MPYTIFLNKKMCYFSVLFNRDIIVNLDQLHFPSLIFLLNQMYKFSISLFFHLLNQTQMGEN